MKHFRWLSVLKSLLLVLFVVVVTMDLTLDTMGLIYYDPLMHRN